VIAAPSPDREQMCRALDVLHAPNAIIEIRALHKRRKQTDAGYYNGDHRDQLIDEAVRLNNEGAAVYVALNPSRPATVGSSREPGTAVGFCPESALFWLDEAIAMLTPDDEVSSEND
jgi:hypothetical protein